MDPPSKSPRKLPDGQGLYLWVMPNGKKYWRFTYRIHEKQKTLALGVYPEVTLKEARNKRLEARKVVSNGKDPSLERKKTKAMAIVNAQNTFKAIAEEWYELKKDSWKPRYADEVIKRLKEDIFPEIGDYPIKEIEPPLLLQVIVGMYTKQNQLLLQQELKLNG